MKAAALARRDRVVAQLEVARAALARATSIREVKRVTDVAAAAEVYARRQRLGEEAIGLAHGLKIDALARLGELLEGMPKATGTRGQFSGKVPKGGKSIGSYTSEPPINLPPLPTNLPPRPTYAALGLDKRTAMVAQQLAGLPEKVRRAVAKRETTLTEARRRTRQ